ncbi:MAG: 4Fe-4S dicluster domain-containing protein [Gammaproteobacteria bacterium]|nr:4Fe-4S dicluster domain-containing protein [Gammaproteobacteria bacterium]
MPQETALFPLADADKCVKCALCLPHCPTYRISLDEGESPRGRIALMQAFAGGTLALTPALSAHLDHCLACRACEAVCPAQVPYGKLIDAARALLHERGQREPWLVRLFAACMRNPVLLKSLHLVLWLSQRLGLQTIAALWPRFRQPLQMLPKLAAPRRLLPIYPTRQTGSPEVQLFLGCVARMVEPGVTQAAIRVLNTLGCKVRIPAAQGCCGALDQHAGRASPAARAVLRNLEAFGGDTPDPILHTASGCGATLGEYPQLLADARTAQFSHRCRDISAFIAGHDKLGQVAFQPLRAKVLLHTPCTLRNVLKSGAAVAQMLRHIPELKLALLPDSIGCCGAAGSHVLSQPALAERLADPVADAVRQTGADFLLTSNVGCRLHLQAAMRRHGLPVRVLHPLELMAMLLPGDDAPAV